MRLTGLADADTAELLALRSQVGRSPVNLQDRVQAPVCVTGWVFAVFPS